MKPRKLLSLNAWPVVQRELREGARRPFNYWLRVGAGTAGLLMVLYITQSSEQPQKVMGELLFAGLHVVLMGLICLVVPWMTADCIAREKREGTLGLLFLTPLTAGGIVAGKGFAQALRALTLWVSVAPVLTIPFVMGGIGWADASSALALEFSALVLCLAAGLLASTLVKGRGAAFVVALLLGAFFVFIFCQLVCFWFLTQISVLVPVWPFGHAWLLSGLPMEVLLENEVVGIQGIIPSPAAIGHVWHQTLWASPIPALLLFVIVLRFAAWRVAKSWQDKTPSLRQAGLVRKYCTPLFQHWSARRTRRTLDRNPVAWLQQYSWKARLAKWGLCLAFILVEGLARSDDTDQILLVQMILLLVLAAVMTFVGVSTFLHEKRSGALELLLITPIRVPQIIFGRAWGLWKQFFPAVLVVAIYSAMALWLQYHYFFTTSTMILPIFPLASLVVCSYLSLPVFTTYFALRVKNMFVAAILTWVALVVSVSFGALTVGALHLLAASGEPSEFGLAVGFFLGSVSFTLLTCFLLRHSLSRRIYSF